MLSKLLAIHDPRYRRAALTSLLNVIAQLIQITTAFISVPIALEHVGSEQFGLWVTLTTALTFITFADFGIGIGAQNRISQARAESNQKLAALFFYTAITFAFITALVVFVSGITILKFIDLGSLFSLRTTQAAHIAETATQIVIATLALGIPAGIIQRTYQALQDGYVVAVLQIASRAVSLCLLFVVVRLDFGLVWIIFAINSLPIIFLLVGGYIFLVRRHKWLSPCQGRPAHISLTAFKSITQLGLAGLGALISVYLINNLPPFIISTKYGADQIVDYGAVLRLISAPTLVFSYLLLPLWPALTEAHAKQEKDWIKIAYLRCLYLTVFFSAISATLLILFGQDFIYYWTKNTTAIPNTNLLYACTALLVAGYWNTLVSVLLNGLSRFKGQATYGLFLALLFSVIAFAIPTEYGKEAIIWTVSAGYFLRCGIMHYELHKVLFDSAS